MADDNKGKQIGYWVTTGLVAAGMLAGGVGDLIAPPEVAKILAVATILAPGFTRLKEWAYARRASEGELRGTYAPA